MEIITNQITIIDMKRIEFTTTRQYFGLGLAWSNGGDYQYYNYISVIIGCLIIQFNFNFNYPQV